MFQNLSIRTRLSGWYLISVTLIVAGMGVTSWWAMRASLYSMIDLELQRRTFNSRTALLQNTIYPGGRALPNCTPSSPGIGLSRIFSEEGTLICVSEDFKKYGISAPVPSVKLGKLTIRNVQSAGGAVRLGATLDHFDNYNLIIEWGEPLSLTENSLRTFTRLLLIFAPVIIGLVVIVSYVISRRALAPVDLIIRDARSIHSGNLSERLSVPSAHDELRRLCETLNSMLDRIEYSVRRVQQFTADASHELRSPITLIRAATGYCLDRERSREDMNEAMVRIDREATHTTQLIDDLLLLARFDAHTDRSQISSVDLAAAARDALERIAPLAENKPVSLEIDLPPGPIWIKEGLDPVERLVFILVDNAVKYTPPDGRVRVSLTVEPRFAVLKVSDTGIGIADEDLPYIFDRFWRSDKVRSRQMGGTGLGLSIAQTILQQCDGSIQAESTAGHGSQFIVQIPLLDSLPISMEERL